MNIITLPLYKYIKRGVWLKTHNVKFTAIESQYESIQAEIASYKGGRTAITANRVAEMLPKDSIHIKVRGARCPLQEHSSGGNEYHHPRSEYLKTQGVVSADSMSEVERTYAPIFAGGDWSYVSYPADWEIKYNTPGLDRQGRGKIFIKTPYECLQVFSSGRAHRADIDDIEWKNLAQVQNGMEGGKSVRFNLMLDELVFNDRVMHRE